MTSPAELAAGLVPAMAARADLHDREASFPKEDIDDLRRTGLLALMVPEELGGMGGGFEDYVRVAVELATGSAATALIYNMHSAVVGSLAGLPPDLLDSLGVSDTGVAHVEEMLRRAAGGAMYGVAISEEGDTSPLSGRRTTFREEDGGYRIEGQKVACSGAGHLDGYLVAAAREPGSDQVSYFLVPAGPGVEAFGTWDPLGMRATASRRLRLDVHVPREALLGEVEGVAVPLAHAMPEWLTASYAAVYVGVAEAAVRVGSDDLAGRSVVPPSRRAMLGRAVAAVNAARCTLVAAAAAVDSGRGSPEANRLVYAAKLIAGDTAVRVAQDVVEATGLRSLTRGSPLERIYRDARMGALMPPRSDVAADILGAMALGRGLEGLEVPPW